MIVLRWLARLLGISIGRKRVEGRGTPATTAYEHGVGDRIFGRRATDGHMAHDHRPPVTLPTAKRPTAAELMHPVKPPPKEP